MVTFVTLNPLALRPRLSPGLPLSYDFYLVRFLSLLIYSSYPVFSESDLTDRKGHLTGLITLPLAKKKLIKAIVGKYETNRIKINSHAVYKLG